MVASLLSFRARVNFVLVVTIASQCIQNKADSWRKNGQAEGHKNSAHLTIHKFAYPKLSAALKILFLSFYSLPLNK